jgi:long-subunit acyl-CoA synthetase (AMP-forming)
MTQGWRFACRAALVMCFVRAGLALGDRVAIWAHNGNDWIITCCGVQAAGGVEPPLSTRFKGTDPLCD